MRLVLRGLIPWSPIADYPKAAEAPRKEEGNSDSAGDSKVHDYLNWLSIVRLDVDCEMSTGFKQFHKKWVCNTTDFPKPPPYSPCHYQSRWFFSQHFVRENHLKLPSAICTFCLFFSGFCSDFSYFHLVFPKTGNQDKTGCDISPKCSLEMFQPLKTPPKNSRPRLMLQLCRRIRFFFSVKIRGNFWVHWDFEISGILDQDFADQSWWRTHQLLF